MQLSLSKSERSILVKKYVNSGMDYPEANKKIKKIVSHLKSLILKLKDQKKSKDEINRRFRREFIKLYQK